MALQTKVYTQTSNTFTLELTLVEDSTSASGNSSSISYTLKLKSTTKNFAQYGVGAEVKLDNRSVAFRDRWNAPKITLGTYSEVTLLSGTATVGHNNDGSKSMPFVYSLDMSAASYTPGPMNGSGSMALSTIPREAKMTIAPNFTDEDNPTIQYSNPGNFPIYAYIEVREPLSRPIAERRITGTSYTFCFTESERNALRSINPTSNTQAVRFVVRTDMGAGVDPGYTWLDRTLTIKNPAPILNPTVADINPDTLALTGESGNLVKYHSQLAVKTGAKAVKGATLVRQSITCGGLALTGDGTLKGVESGTIVISATDSRGNTTTKTINRKLVGYVRLSCNLGDGAPDASGHYNLEITGACYYGNFGKAENALTVQYRYRKQGADSWGDWTAVDSVLPMGFTYLARAKVEGLDYQTAYEFQAMATDQLETVTSTERAVKSLPTFDWSGTDFNVNVDLYIRGKPFLDYIYPVGSIYMSVNPKNPGTWFGGTWVAWGEGRVPVGVNTSDGSFNSVEKTGGEKNHKLSLNEIPNHGHSTNINLGERTKSGSGIWAAVPGEVDNIWVGNSLAVGGGEAHNNLQPYITCYMWKRTA